MSELQQRFLCVARFFTGGVAILPVLWMTSYLHIMSRKRRREMACIVKLIHNVYDCRFRWLAIFTVCGVLQIRRHGTKHDDWQGGRRSVFSEWRPCHCPPRSRHRLKFQPHLSPESADRQTKGAEGIYSHASLSLLLLCCPRP